ncbi:MmgE/PrpD family protein [Halegenticoccus tardaugens]|uniref:MmgE/PrpD family protein n=1 Tax=Halegenticoccus tardaugens TaxID=2071624 RepID=UPI00100C0038|nr:MmgE/PrpD family protein [Halegenticoccus tardaugens]
MSTTKTYAEFCASLAYDDLPDDVVEHAKRLVLDTVGIAVGSGNRAASSESFVDGIGELDGGGDGATILATGGSASPAYAAFLNGAMAHSLDYDDTHRAASLHPGAPVVPAALAAAEKSDASGKEFLAGVVAGYEIVCRLGMAVNPASHYGRGFHMTGTCGTFGATAAAGVVSGWEARTFEAAFGLNGSQAAGSLQFLENGGWNKRAHPGWAAHAALVGGALAEAGFFAASNPIDGDRGFLRGYSDDPDPEKATEGLGDDYELLKVGVKPYPCCRYMHAPMDLLFDVAASEGVDPADVESVRVRIATPGVELVGHPANAYPESFVDAQFSMPFGAALVLGRGDAGVDAFLDAVEGGVPDDLRELIDRTAVESAAWIDEAYPEKWASDVVVETDDGTYEAAAEYARGEPENPLSRDELVAKFDELAEPVLGDAATVDARERLASLESIDVADLIEPFARDRAAANAPAAGD